MLSRTDWRGLGLPTIQLRDHFGNNGAPPCLMTGSDPGAAAAMEIFVEEEEITPQRILLKLFNRAIEGASSVVITAEDTDEALFQLKGNLPEVEFPAGACREFHFEIVAEEMAEFLKRFDQ